jgi:hypothetical protein
VGACGMELVHPYKASFMHQMHHLNKSDRIVTSCRSASAAYPLEFLSVNILCEGPDIR